MKKTLHILKTEPDNTAKALIDIMSGDEGTLVFELYKKEADYDELLDLLFEYDRAVSWW